MIFNNRVKYALALYLGFITCILLLKPKFLFKSNGEFKAFGTGKDKTIFPFWMLILITIIISYYLANILILIQF